MSITTTADSILDDISLHIQLDIDRLVPILTRDSNLFGAGNYSHEYYLDLSEAFLALIKAHTKLAR